MKLCPECKVLGKCWFENEANKIADAKSDRKSLDDLLDQALEKHKKITELRIESRKKMCPNLNNIDPDYTGKELL